MPMHAKFRPYTDILKEKQRALVACFDRAWPGIEPAYCMNGAFFGVDEHHKVVRLKK